MSHCVSCRFWDEETAEDNAEGEGVCAFWSAYVETAKGVRRLCVTRTRGDERCPQFSPRVAIAPTQVTSVTD